ncbi:hypothetical protein JHK87_033950 [Glycine soja]|nr:hypothetical protein JHK87_033950 [Glycine soja]
MSPFYASFSLSPSIPLCCCAATFVPPPHYLLHQIVTRGLLLFLLLLLLPKDKTPSPPPKRQKVDNGANTSDKPMPAVKNLKELGTLEPPTDPRECTVQCCTSACPGGKFYCQNVGRL